jgi:Fur family ferric uptake transcriptional regulator
MKHPLVVFEEYIAHNKLKITPQRRKIVDMLLKSEGHHLSAEEFHMRLKSAGVNVGQATVYRTLKLLCASGLAREVRFGDGVSRYELEYGSEHHDHLICETCGKQLEVIDKDIERLQELLAIRYGFTLISHRMNLYGICEPCRKGEK